MDPISSKELLQNVQSVLDAAKEAENDSPPDRDRALDGLKLLLNATVTTTVLAETHVGKRIRVLAKHPNPDIASAASKVIACWKNIVRRQSFSNTKTSVDVSTKEQLPRVPSVNNYSNSVAEAAAAATTKSVSEPLLVDTSQTPPVPPPSSPPHLPPTTTTNTTAINEPCVPGSQSTRGTVVSIDAFDIISEVPTTGDTVRDKIRANLVSALRRATTEGVQSELNATDLGVSIELALYNAHKGATQPYKAKFRQLHFNLKDEKNPDLRRRVMDGTIPPHVLITLGPEELASDAKREENEKIREKKLFDSAPSAVKQATTDQFQCGKCKQRKTTYYQMQTRSADEPMTTFVTCLNCNNRWKFC